MIRLRSTSLPLTRQLRTARGSIDRRHCVVIRVSEPVGTGEAAPLPGWTESLEEAEAALRRVADSPANAHERDATDSVSDLPAARHGLSLAYRDRDARVEGKPLYRYLDDGGTVNSIPVNATIGDDDANRTVLNAEAAETDGFDCIKVKVGNRSVREDVERVRAIREALPEVGIRLDANGGWSRAEAELAIDGVAPLDIDYLEQPLAPRDIDGHESLGSAVDIALDESMAYVDRDEIESLSVEAIVCKPMVLGGIDRARDVATAARAAGIEPVISNTVDGAVARTAAVHLAASLAPVPHCGLATARRLRTDYATDPAPVTDGTMRVPQTPGHGVAVDW